MADFNPMNIITLFKKQANIVLNQRQKDIIALKRNIANRGRIRGRIPKVVSEFLASNPDVAWECCVCWTHKKWFCEIDHLAPYHWELCVCRECLRQKG